MKLSNIAFLVAVGAASLVVTDRVLSQAGGEGEPSMAEMMALAAPAEEHALLRSLEGDWDQTYSMWAAPGGQPMKSRGTGKARMILGGRFLELTSEGTMMGTQVETMQIMGYDRRHGEFTFVGFDTMGTYSVSARGKGDAKTRNIKVSGTDDDPAGKQHYKFHMDIKSADEYVFTVYFTQIGGMKFEGGFKAVEVAATRKK